MRALGLGGRDEELGGLGGPQGQARTPNLELEDPTHVCPPDDAHLRAGEQAELHQASPERPVATEPHDAADGAVGEGVEAHHGVTVIEIGSQLKVLTHILGSGAGRSGWESLPGGACGGWPRAEESGASAGRSGLRSPARSATHQAMSQSEVHVSRAKQAAGRRAADFVEDGMILGLGTGSTIAFTLERLAERVREEKLQLVGVPTSLDTERKALELGLELTTLERRPSLDLTIDGADEVDPGFHMTKGGGGALLREKVVAEASRREVICLGKSKLVERLGRTFPLPVEVVPFAGSAVSRQIEALGAACVTRQRDGKDYLTDNGNEILDCTFPEGIEDPSFLNGVLSGIAGVVENGLFIDLAHVLVIADDEGNVEIREKS